VTDAEQRPVIDTDVLIVGAGPVGMTLALKLQHGDTPPLSVLLLDARARGSHAGDPRALALSHGTRQLLEPLDAWNAAAGTGIHDIHVSQAGGFGRTILSREEHGLPALGYVMRYRDLASALDKRIGDDRIVDNCQILDVTIGRDHVAVSVRHRGGERLIRARLVVHAEGTPGASTDIFVSDYHQHAVLAEVRPLPAHGHRAWERFTPDGPLALLPLGEDYSVVFTVPSAKADALMTLSDDDFLSALQRQFGSRLAFSSTSPRARYPLALRLRRTLCAEREVWIGNSAQTLHPVSGQGFNLGIRDACELADQLLDDTNADPGMASRLEVYARGRLVDRAGSAAFTDGIVRAFSNNIVPLRLGRGLGLLVLDLCAPARKFVAGRMIWGARGF
jgi:2-octaprenyl-6-methoxyphenol hydroxylase